MLIREDKEKNMEQDIILKKVQKVELEILDVVHKVCVENHLKYSLAYGTLLGAVRHRGFIPWDAEIDICRPREDYDKLIEIWPKYKFEDYILQNIETDEEFTQNFTKIRKNHTTFLQPKEEQYKYHKGVFIDIFPGDRVPDSKLKRQFQFFNMAVNLLYSRKFKSGSSSKMISTVENILLLFPKSFQKKYRKVAENVVKRYNSNSKFQYVFANTIDASKIYYPDDIFESLVLADFEDEKFYIYKDYDNCLKIEYGNYMELPPEKERSWTHAPELIDFHRNYEEIEK